MMAKKQAGAVLPKLTEAEQDLIWHMEHGYKLETDSLGGDPVLRRLKDDEVVRPASANRNTITGDAIRTSGVQLFADLDRYELWDTPGIRERAHDILGGQSAHGQCQVAFEGCFDGASIDPLDVFCGARTTNQFHQEFCVLHSLLSCREVLLRTSRCEKG
jgi:hypothetical protein